MKLFLVAIAWFWLSVAAGAWLWWRDRRYQRRLSAAHRPQIAGWDEPEDGVQVDPYPISQLNRPSVTTGMDQASYDAGLIRLLEDIRRGETSVPER
jgi:hypothetical protein